MDSRTPEFETWGADPSYEGLLAVPEQPDDAVVYLAGALKDDDEFAYYYLGTGPLPAAMSPYPLDYVWAMNAGSEVVTVLNEMVAALEPYRMNGRCYQAVPGAWNTAEAFKLAWRARRCGDLNDLGSDVAQG